MALVIFVLISLALQYASADPSECERFPAPQHLNQLGLFNVFNTHALTGANTLACVGYRIFQERNLFSSTSLGLDPVKVFRFLSVIESKYNRTITYHNHLHAADVLQMTNALLSVPRLQGVFSDKEVLATLLAAAGHDVEHFGMTNKFLVATEHKWAEEFENKSPLENHHLAVTLAQLAMPELNVLSTDKLDANDQTYIKDLIRLLILGTDNANHGVAQGHLADLVVKVKRGSDGRLELDDNQKKQVLEFIVHLADISNPTKSKEVYEQWTGRVMDEFYAQGSEEKRLGLPISGGCDRDKDTPDSSQIFFIDTFVRPFWCLWSVLVSPNVDGLMRNLVLNRQSHNSKR